MALTDLIGPATGAFSGALAMIQPIGRSIGSVIPDVVIEEAHRDESVITRQPVEGGRVVTDHIFDLPPSVEIRGGFSNSTAGYEGYVQEQYQELLRLKAKKQPFFLSTGKRAYQNMVVRAIQVVTDPHSEYVLMFSAILENINIVSTSQSGSDPTTASTSSDKASQSDPAATASTSNSGTIDGIGVGNQSFAGSFSPGSASATPSATDTNSGSASAGTIGANGSSAFSGFSPAGVALPPPDDGIATFTTPDGATVTGSGQTTVYDPFSSGAFGGT